MIRTTCAITALLMLMALWSDKIIAQEAEGTPSPVEEMNRAADEIQRLQKLLREAQKAERGAEAKELVEQLRGAVNRPNRV